MKAVKLLFCISFLVFSLSLQLLAQHDLVVPPWNGSNYLNDIVIGDTLASGQRADTLRTYVLQRNGIYFVNTPIRNTGWVLRMKSQAGNGLRPRVYLVKNTSTGNIPAAFIQIASHISLKGLMISGILDGDTSAFSLMQGQLIGTNQPGFDVALDSCVLTNSNGNHIRTDQAQRVMKITNCIFADMGYLGRSNLGAGKAIDLRAGSMDSLYIVNSTFVNFQDRIIRHFLSTAAINNLNFDHNTIVNGMSYHGTLVLGIVGNKVSITNNLFIDAFALGNDTDFVRQAEFNESGELDPYGGRRMSWIFSINNTTTQWKVSNNYYAISDSGLAFYTRHLAAGVTGEGSPLSWHINGRLGSDSVNAFKKINLTLIKTPKLMTNMMDWYRRPAAQGGAGKTKSTTNFNRLLHDYDRKNLNYYHDTLNCGYSTSSVAYTGAQGGFPVGDLNWFPAKKAEWQIWITDVESEFDYLPSSFTLNQNYPNPFNPSTKISFFLEKAGNTVLSIYNLLGQKVATVLAKELSAGYHQIDFDAAALSSGVYFYRLESGDFSAVKKMTVLK